MNDPFNTADGPSRIEFMFVLFDSGNRGSEPLMWMEATTEMERLDAAVEESAWRRFLALDSVSANGATPFWGAGHTLPLETSSQANFGHFPHVFSGGEKRIWRGVIWR